MNTLAVALLVVGAVVVPVWLLSVGRHLGRRSRRVRGAFWGGIAGHFVGEMTFLGALLTPPLLWPTRTDFWLLALLLVVPPALGVGVGAVIGRRRSARR